MTTTVDRSGAARRATPWPTCWPAAAAVRLMELTDKPRQARGLFRRQVAHHRFRAVQRPQFRHPPHRRRDPVQGAQPDPPSAARLELPPRPSATRASTSCRRASASRRTQWYAGTADAVYQNIDIIETYGPEYMVILAGDHIYKMDYELMLQQHVDAGRRRHRRLPRGAAHGGDRLRRHACRRARTASSPSWRSRRTRRACPDNPDMALASMGIYVFETQVPVRAAAPRRRRPELEPRLRQGHHPLPGQERQGRGASLRRVLRRAPTSEAEAYWRDVGTVDAYWEANIDLTDVVPALDLYDQRLADLDLWRDHAAGQVRPRRGGPARPGGEFAGLGRLHRLRRRRCAARCCSPACASTPTPRSRRRGPALCRDRPPRPAEERRHRPRRARSPKGWWSARTRSSTPSASAAPTRASA